MKIIQMKRVLRWTLLVLLMVALVLLIFVSLREPSLSRTWDEDVSILAGVEVSKDEVVTLTQIRDWSYAISSISSIAVRIAVFKWDPLRRAPISRISWPTRVRIRSMFGRV